MYSEDHPACGNDKSDEGRVVGAWIQTAPAARRESAKQESALRGSAAPRRYSSGPIRFSPRSYTTCARPTSSGSI